MYIPIVPVVPHTKVVNKTIIYGDTILPLKDKIKNANVTIIEKIDIDSLEACLKKILTSNPDVVFAAIQYSKKYKKVYLYTNKEITIEEYKEDKCTKYKPITSKSEILEEVKKLLTSPKIKDDTCISLSDVADLLSHQAHDYTRIIENYSRYLNEVIKSKFMNSSTIYICNFDYNKKELTIRFCYCRGDDTKKIVFRKNDEDLEVDVTKSDTYWTKEILATIGSDLSELYDELVSFLDYKKGINLKIRPVNSNFLVDITSYGIDIYTPSTNNEYMDYFELTFNSHYNQYSYDSTSMIIMNTLQEHETEIFKNIFVKIEDCPKWCQEMLYDIRQKQLEEEQRMEEEKKQREAELQRKEQNKQKRLTLVKKFLPFIKK